MRSALILVVFLLQVSATYAAEGDWCQATPEERANCVNLYASGEARPEICPPLEVVTAPCDQQSAPTSKIVCQVTVNGVLGSKNKFEFAAGEKLSSNRKIYAPGSPETMLGVNWDGGKSNANLFLFATGKKAPGAWAPADFSPLKKAEAKARVGSVGFLNRGVSYFAECSVQPVTP